LAQKVNSCFECWEHSFLHTLSQACAPVSARFARCSLSRAEKPQRTTSPFVHMLGLVATTSVLANKYSSPEHTVAAPQSIEAPFWLTSPGCRWPPVLPFSPPDAPHKVTMPPLLVALSRNSLEQAKRVCEADPESAREPFWEHKVEPPLCCAVRMACDVAIIKLLLDFGADVFVANDRGQLPLSILASKRLALPPWPAVDGVGTVANPFVEGSILSLATDSIKSALFAEYDATLEHHFEMTEALVAAGADPRARDPAGNRPLDLAMAAGNDKLVRFFVEHAVAQRRRMRARAA